MGIHQPDQVRFRSVLPEDIDWKPFPAFPAFPPSARLAIVVGEPSKSGPYVTYGSNCLAASSSCPTIIRKALPTPSSRESSTSGISGVFSIGLGSRFDEGQLQAYPPGAVIVLPRGNPQLQWAKSGTYVIQVTAIGPLGLAYIDPVEEARSR